MADDDHDHDAAGVANLQQILAAAQRESRAAQGLLQSSTAKFMSASHEVVALVGGSAQSVDKQVVASLEAAMRQTSRAVSALGGVR